MKQRKKESVTEFKARVTEVGHVQGSDITNNVYTSVSLNFMEQEMKKIN